VRRTSRDRQPRRTPDSRTTKAPGAARVLIIDDDQSMCEVLAEYLARQGHRPTWRTSAVQALELLERDDLEVVVTDLNTRYEHNAANFLAFLELGCIIVLVRRL
jgi:PleD family two-component response regulator